MGWFFMAEAIGGVMCLFGKLVRQGLAANMRWWVFGGSFCHGASMACTKLAGLWNFHGLILLIV